MSYFAKIEQGIVTQVIAADQEFIDGLEGQWLQTSYNTHGNKHPENKPLRGNYAGIGYTYDLVNDVFYAPQPYPSWTLNQSTWLWESPTPMPVDVKGCKWDEPTNSWVLEQG